MDPIAFSEHNIVIAEDQPQYRPIPAFVVPHDAEGKVLFCWKLTWKERLHLLCTGKLWHQVMTFGHPLQPQLLSVEKPHIPLVMPPLKPRTL